MINDNPAAPIHKIATKSFEKMSDPDKITIQRLFVRYWDDFLEDTEVIKNGVRPVVLQEVERMMSCGTAMLDLKSMSALTAEKYTSSVILVNQDSVTPAVSSSQRQEPNLSLKLSLMFLIVMSFLPLTKDYADSSRKIVCYSMHSLKLLKILSFTHSIR